MAYGVSGRIFALAAILPLVAVAVAEPGLLRAEPVTLSISRADCQRLTEYVPAPGVEYEPGVDIHGRPVAPADVAGTPTVRLPEVIELDIEVDLQDRSGFPANASQFEADAEIGTVLLRPDGRATFNGQPLQDEAQAALTARCQEILYGKP